MLAYIIRRVAYAFPILLGVNVFLFLPSPYHKERIIINFKRLLSGLFAPVLLRLA